MVFNSFHFIIFFPLLTIIYYLTPSRVKWITLLIGSYFFYINIKPVYTLLVAGVTLSTYLFARLIEKTNSESKKKVFLRISIIFIILPLFFFKYFNSINEAVFELLKSMHIRFSLPEIKLIIPVGISFYTFMAIGYIVDVYNEKIKAEKNLGVLALFISFFPLILAGPIERAKNTIPQFKAPKNIDYSRVVQGLKMMLWGYFMKLVVADRIGIYLSIFHGNVDYFNGTSLLVATILYPFQIYADFAGYSLIAIGSAKILGIEVMQNFNRPFFASSMTKLWRRWHISLISWLTDYIFTPLSFSFRKFKKWGMVISLTLTFIICGIWHGAALNYIMWGLVQSVFLSFEVLTSRWKIAFEKKHNLSNKYWYIFIGIFITFILFDASQIFGWANSFDDAITIFIKIFTNRGPISLGEDSAILYYAIMGIAFMMFTEFIAEYFPQIKALNSSNKYTRFFSVFFIIVSIITLGVFDGSQFIYFHF
jgi:alginate O-acetyltransferase complex protein AlgI